MLDRPGVAAVIVGARSRAHLAISGEVYEVERDHEGPHSCVMRYELNRTAG